MTNYIVTLKWGKLYGPEYVNRLAAAVEKNCSLPLKVVCFTDDPAGIDDKVEIHPIPEIDLPDDAKVTGWRKLCLFRNDLPIEGMGLFLDLDLVITGSLDDFFTHGHDDKIYIIHNWVQWHKKIFRPDPKIGNSSVFRFKLNHCDFVWNQFHSEKEWALANFQPPQSYLTHCIRDKMVFWPDSWVRSFKRHAQPSFPLNLLLTPKLPKDAKIMAFHGRPNPEEVIDGYKARKLHHRCKPTPWVAQHWLQEP